MINEKKSLLEDYDDGAPVSESEDVTINKNLNGSNDLELPETSHHQSFLKKTMVVPGQGTIAELQLFATGEVPLDAIEGIRQLLALSIEHDQICLKSSKIKKEKPRWIG